MALTNLARPVDYRISQPDYSPIANLGLAYAGRQKQQDQMAQKQAIITEAQDLFRAGDMDAIGEFAIANPELGKTMFEMGGIRDEAAQQRMVGLSKNLTMSPSPVQDLTSYIAQGEANGQDMSHSKKMLENSGGNPEQLKKMAEIGWAANDPATYKSYRTTLPEGQEPMTAYQSSMVESKKIDQDLRREEAMIKRDENKLKRETDELKREELKNKIEASKQKVEANKQGKIDSANTAINASEALLSSIDQLAGNEGYINSLTGYRGRLPASATDEGVEAEALYKNITDSLTLDNLKLMTGVLTDKDIELLRSAASGLKQGMGVERFTEILGTIRGKVETGLKSKQDSMPKKATVDTTDDELLNKYGG